MAKRVNVPISSARARLFHLTDLVRTSGDDTVVVLEQRGAGERVALVREARLAYLEARAGELERREKPAFTLAGSLASDLDDDSLVDALRAIRKEWTPVVTPMEAVTRPAATRQIKTSKRRIQR
jgi:2-phospho-L-lactate guanylyltransferase (CobY/MobA/RfbA family)